MRVARAVVIVSHRGRPASINITAGKPAGTDMRLSLRRDAAKLGELLHAHVRFIPHFRFGEMRRSIAEAPGGTVFLLENIRFLPGEAKSSPALARQLALLADYYVNDAFAVSHRTGASITGVAKLLPSYMGFELEREIEILSKVMRRPAKPFVAVLGGSKTEEKLGVIRSLRRTADAFLIGGAAANTLLYLRGVDVGKSKRDTDNGHFSELRRVLRWQSVKIPVDWRTKGGAILDIGPKTTREFSKHIASARTILWSGTMGLIEKKPFDKGTLAVARAIAASRRAFKVAGGGETVMLLKQHKLDKKFDFVSTGGGAMLEFLAGRKLPGIEALK
jgi:phosphoglycerate kinase